ncbi:MAG TPA: hypothetical protein RMI29_06745 [Polyangiaceae bacterium LLY-WYZ-15_(1-7)]|nr:hypothetical protein [Polyangiaceae bacterium LLY-WYZ-15_(1-7)]HJL01090.1 hypothetical protein [Polyangiaceae bacterium LLY-WYZ-15_(1-7)]HJL22268.1 hypothetical protein [Polyangiaceae bacterium LLY-WYZ-15_(1-7)]HJL29862.1 hypothetical protein [Polyangiaceae bacterium LLY-WYZ-15_(1-7)]HJL37961.1 hypothetical protein [Polyangiaceae bacterium LLY-WYZ-15_(1-7)]
MELVEDVEHLVLAGLGDAEASADFGDVEGSRRAIAQRVHHALSFDGVHVVSWGGPAGPVAVAAAQKGAADRRVAERA